MNKKICITLVILIFIISTNMVYAKTLLRYNDIIINSKLIEEETEYIKSNLCIPNIIINDNPSLSNEISEKIYNDILNWRNDLTELAHQYEDELESDNLTFIPFELATKYEVFYNKKGFIIISIIYYQYTGGAHGLSTKISYNYDLKNGQLLELKDLFKEGSNYEDKINNFINEEMKKNPSIYFKNKEGKVKIENNQDFYISNNGLVVYFQLYEIAPYSSGIQEFVIPYSLLDSDLKIKLD